MKAALNLALACAFTMFFAGCWSWQEMVSFGLWQSDAQKQEARINKEQDELTTKCDEGDIVACNNLAVNFSMLKNYEDAKIYYEKACEAGLATACSNLGQIYEQGLAHEITDVSKALELYRDACEAGDGVGCYNEALLIYTNATNKQPKNQAKSVQASLALLAKSCRLDYAQACFLLAKLTNDQKRAKKLYERACKLGKCEK